MDNLPKKYIQDIRILAEKCYTNKQHSVTDKLSPPHKAERCTTTIRFPGTNLKPIATSIKI